MLAKFNFLKRPTEETVHLKIIYYVMNHFGLSQASVTLITIVL